MTRMPIDFRIGDVVRLRKPHPCGGTDWTVVRLGADIGLRCLKCSHRIMITRREAEHGTKSFISRAEAKDPLGSFEAERDAAERAASAAGSDPAPPADDA